MTNPVRPTPYKLELRTKILDVAMNQFKQKGIRNVRMDDIATMLGISKRTLYEIYNNKEQLLYEGVVRDEEMRSALIHEFSRTAENEMEIIVEVLKMKLRELGQINPLFFSELHKYETVVEYLRQTHLKSNQESLSFFLHGVEGGFFRKHVNYELILQMSNAVMNHVVEEKLYNRVSLQDIFVNYVNVIIRGLCTEKGLEILNAKLPDSSIM